MNEIAVKNISKTVKIKNKSKTILTDVNFNINKGEFIAIVGSSGAGKSTLINALTGYKEISKGTILYEGIDLSENYRLLKNKIGYVPQKEILHMDLTLKSALKYSYELKNNCKYDKNGEKLINDLLNNLCLSHAENTLMKNLSGGERKRAAIATELLDNPDYLFLDEPTSGLDSNIEKKLMNILKDISLQGRTVIITAHTVSNLYLCNKIIFMGENGKICFYGTYEESLKYFNVNEFVDIYDLLKDNTDYWFNLYNQFINKNKKDSTVKNNIKLKENKISFFNQLRLLSKRYIEIIFNNKALALLLIIQAPIMGYLISVVGPRNSLEYYDKAKIVFFAVSCASLWLGLFNSIQEIVKEKDIIKKEYSDNLKLSSYILSKLLVLGGLAILQSILLIFVLSIFIDLPATGVILDSGFFEYFISCFLINFSCCAIGLFVSSIVKTTEITLIIAPFFMMFQLLYSGALMKLQGISKLISNVINGRWAMEALGTTSNFIHIAENSKLELNTSTLNDLESTISKGLFLDEAIEFYTYSTIHLASVWLIFIIIITIFVILSILSIKRILKTG